MRVVGWRQYGARSIKYSTANALGAVSFRVLSNGFIWIAARVDSDFGKFIGIFWCLFAFISSGFEHSVANMTVFALAALDPFYAVAGFSGVGHNLMWVTLGNTFSGVVFMGLAYWHYGKTPQTRKQPPPDSKTH